MKHIYKNNRHLKNAFTLIELLIVIAIIGILFIVLVSKVDFATDKSKATGVQTDFRSFQLAFETVAREYQGFSELVSENNYLKLAEALNKNLDNKLKVNIDTMGNITMKNSTKDPWGTEYHGQYVTGNDGKDRGAIIIYSNGANTKFGSDIVLTGGIASVTVINEFGKDDYSIVSCYSLAGDSGRIETTVNGFINIENNNHLGGDINNPEIPVIPSEPVEPEIPDETEPEIPMPNIPEAPSIEGVVPGLYESGSNYTVQLKTWDELIKSDLRFSSSTKSISQCSTSINGDLLIPNTVTAIAMNTFANCTGLTSVRFEEGSVLTQISDEAFYKCSNLKSIILPDSLTNLGETVFSYSGLEYIVIPEGITTIKREMFEYCSSLTDVQLPSTITTIEKYGFSFCNSLENINLPEGLTSIDAFAFRYCESLTTLYFPSTISFIGGNILGTEAGAFESCKNLTTVIFAKDCQLATIGESAFKSCSNLSTFVLPNAVTTIKAYAFSGCTSLVNISIPNSLKTLGNCAFNYCTALQTIEFEKNSILTTIGYGAFYNCTNLESISIPASVEKIDGHHQYGGAFEKCTGLKSFIVEDNSKLSSIGSYSFKGCASLESVLMDFDSLLTTMGKETFYGCKLLKNVVLPNTLNEIGVYAFYECSALETINIPDGVAIINGGAFYKCKLLKSVNFTDNSNLKYIYNYWYNGTYGAFAFCELLEKFEFPEGFISLDYATFYKCKSLAELVIPSSLETFPANNIVNAGVIGDCTNLKTVRYTGTLEQWLNINFESSPCNYGASLYIQDELLDDVVIPDTVTKIGPYAFYGCTNITNVYISNSVTEIGNLAFNSCINLINVSGGENLISVGNNAFAGCTNLTSVLLGNNITTMGTGVFINDAKLNTVSISGKLDSLPTNIFHSCSSSKTVYYGGTLEQWLSFDTDYTNSPLYNGGRLYIQGELVTKVVVPDTISILKSYAFYKNKDITTLTIPKSVTSIETNVFRSCTNLTTIYYEGTVEEWQAVEKAQYWCYQSGATYVQCSDGQASLT